MKQKLKTWLYGCFILLISITTKTLTAQTYCSGSTCELVCNGSFETLTNIPPHNSQPGYTSFVEYATGWYQYDVAVGNQTPDLFTTSSPAIPSFYNSVHVPCSYYGYQNAHTGNAYAGLLTVATDNAFLGPKCGEFITSGFSSPLSAGKIYEISLWVSRADLAGNTITSLGVWIGTNNNSINPQTDPPTHNCSTALLNNDDWTLISFPYCADGTEDMIIIGGSSNVYGSSLSIPTATCTQNSNYSSTTSAGSYIFIDDVSVKEAKFTVPSQTVCKNSTFTLTAATQSTACPVTMSNYTYTWSHGDGSSAVNTGTNNTAAHSYTNTGTYTGSLSVSTGSCSVTYTYNVNIPNVTIAVTTNTNTICNGITGFTATPSPSGSYTYTWSVQDAATGTVIPTSNYTITAGTTNTPSINFANINQNVNICVSITNTMGCTFNQCLYMPSCCKTPTNVLKYTNTTFSTSVIPAGTAIAFGGTITINSGGYLGILSKDVTLDPNTKFVINGTGRITFASDYVHGCNAMWDGIYANTTNSITITNSRIEDAQGVIIDALGIASINVSGSYLNKNYMGIVIKAAKTSSSKVSISNTFFSCSNIPITGSIPYIPTIPNLTNAPTLGAYATTNLLPPYNTTKSFCGVYMVNASHTGAADNAIVVGSTTGKENVFDKMQYGAFVSSTRTAFQNNVFQNIKSTIAPISGGASNAAIIVYGQFFGGVGPFYTKVGGASTAFKNTFKDNDRGVVNLLRTHLLIEYNRFENQGTGVFVAYNNNNSSVNVAHNKFVNNKIGINFDQNSNINATILENQMDNITAQGTFADNYAIRCTEAVPATNTNTYAKYDVNNNYINGYYNGVHTSQTFNSSIKDNEIHMRPDNTTWNFQSGIWIKNTNNNVVEQNIVDYPSGTSANWWQYNIFTAGSTLPKIHCNSTNYGGVGIIANGPNLTVAGDGFRGNSMANQSFGFWLNANGEIGDQYYTSLGTNYSADNTWTTCGNETFSNIGCNNYNITGAKFYTRAGVGIYSITTPTNSGNSNLLLGTNNSAGFMGACYVGSATPTLNLRVMQKAPEIAKGTFTFADNDISLKQITRKQLYGNLALQEIDPSYNTDVNDFANSSRHAALGQFFVVDSLINTGDTAKLNTASAINNSVNTTNDVDATQKEFNTLYITHLKNKREANVTEVAAFETIAWLCPNINGHAVYQARSVLFNITQLQYINACEKGDGNSSHRFANAIINEAAVNVKLFPNPSNGNITLQTNDDLSYNIIVYNLLGEKVFESNTSHNQSISLNYLSSATYIVHIHQNGNLIKTERISIIH